GDVELQKRRGTMAVGSDTAEKLHQAIARGQDSFAGTAGIRIVNEAGLEHRLEARHQRDARSGRESPPQTPRAASARRSRSKSTGPVCTCACAAPAAKPAGWLPHP